MKPQNILLGKGGVVKLCDFGYVGKNSCSIDIHTIIGHSLSLYLLLSLNSLDPNLILPIDQFWQDQVYTLVLKIIFCFFLISKQ